MASYRADREVLFRALVVQFGMTSRADLTAADHANPGDRPLADILVERDVLSRDRRALLDILVDDLLDRYSRDLGRCLELLGNPAQSARRKAASVAPGGETVISQAGRERFAGLGPGVEASQPVADSKGRNADQGNASVSEDEEADDEDVDDPDVEWTFGTPSSGGHRFQLIHPHARGGIGIVSIGFDAELQREVALKQIKPESADDKESRARFMLEAEVTGRLEHPGIVPVYGLGTDSQGRPFYAMRFVQGITLEEAIEKFHRGDRTLAEGRDDRRRTLELRRLLTRFIDVCHTVAYAHSRGVLHRDLKPANVLLGPYNETLVVDWGLAKVLGRDGESNAVGIGAGPGPSGSRNDTRGARIIPPLGSGSSTETIAGMAFGTPAYMSPEQAEGQIDRIGTASDVYGLGAVLYTLLSGQPPFEVAWCEVTALLGRVRKGEFPTPRQVAPAVPAPLEAICLRAMATRPEARYRGANELAAEIERWLADEPVSAYADPAIARIGRWSRRHKTMVVGAGMLLLTAVIGLSTGILLLGRAKRETDFQREAAVREREVARYMTREADRRADSLRRRDYINRVNLAHREYLDDNIALADQLMAECPENQRDWEWSYVHRVGHLDVETFSPDDPTAQDVWCLGISPNGQRVAAGSGPWFQARSEPTGRLAILGVPGGREVFSRTGWPGAVQSLAYSPDGKTLVVARGTTEGARGAVLMALDAGSGAIRWQHEERETNILSLAWSADGRTLACGCGWFNNYTAIGHAELRDAANGKIIRELAGGPGGVLAVAFSPDGKQLAMTSRGQVDLREVSSGHAATPLSGHVDFVYAVAYSPDGKWLATGGWDRVIRLWDRRGEKLARTLIGHRGFVRGLAFRADSAQLISCGEDKSVRAWEIPTGREVAAFHGHTGFVHCVAYSPDGQLAVSGSQDGTVKLWPAAVSERQVTFRNGSGWVGTLAFSPDGSRVASIHNGDIRVWDPRTGEEFLSLTGPRGLLGRIGLTYTPDGSGLIASGPGASLQVWDPRSGRLKQILATRQAAITDAAISKDGSRLATVSDDRVAIVWDVPSGKPICTTTAHEAAINAVAFAPDGSHLATAGEDRTAKIWDASNGRLLATLRAHQTGVKDVAFSPDGRLLATVGGNYRGNPAAEVMLWNTATGELVRSFDGHTGLVTAVAFFPGGRRLATASDDRTIKLWDTQTGDDVFTLRGHTSGVVSLAISPDGRQIASGSIDYTARVWSAEPPDHDLALIHRRFAVERVQALFEAHPIKADVLAAARSDLALPEKDRARIYEIASRRTPDAQAMFEAAWLVIVRPGNPAEQYQRALARLDAACASVAADPERLAEYRHPLGLALYRAGRPDEALEVVRRDESEHRRRGEQPKALDLAVIAMASYRLGRHDQARTALESLRSSVHAARNGADPETRAVLQETEALIRSAGK